LHRERERERERKRKGVGKISETKDFIYSAEFFTGVDCK
jgi:hypothetical protein